MLALLVLSITSATPAYTEAEGQRLGKQCQEQKKHCAELAKLATKGCEASNALACFQLGGVLGAQKVPGVQQDLVASRAATHKGCELGSALACLWMVADLTMEAKLDEAYALTQRTCDRGSDDACRLVPSTFQMTKAGDVDYQNPVKLEQQCRDPRTADKACWQLGQSQLSKGQIAAGVRSLDRACQALNTGACTFLSELYSAGDAGVPGDSEKSKAYLKRAVASGPDPFLQHLRTDAGFR